MRALRTVAVACLALGALTACSSSGSTGSTGGSGSSQAASAPAADAAGKGGSKLAPKEALLAAAAVMDKAGSAKLTVKGGGSDGTADYVWKSPSSFLMHTTQEGKQVDVLFAGDQMYIGATPEMAAVAKGKKWMSLSSKDAAGAAGDEAGTFAGMMQMMNPSVQLVAAAPTATLVGTETVAGQSATHYRSDIKVDELVAKMQLDPALKAQVLAELKKNGTSSTVDLWVNSKGELVQQSSADLAADSGGTPGVVTYGDLGSVKATPAPAASEVFSLTDLMQQ
ncbi:hypothetical protein [Kitasatospora cineracea]|uniref:Lipoprotein n=1 Tax=Kitasatospora cineracea TaxID=88074 RepID=A0A8G1XCB2_9ACTN|nr:hypothetical protein [Kitasatospora cineracea]ROR43863.1 hypothetical protein EDD39_2036 [Kitasatospora cineracea]